MQRRGGKVGVTHHRWNYDERNTCQHVIPRTLLISSSNKDDNFPEQKKASIDLIWLMSWSTPQLVPSNQEMHGGKIDWLLSWIIQYGWVLQVASSGDCINEGHYYSNKASLASKFKDSGNTNIGALITGLNN